MVLVTVRLPSGATLDLAMRELGLSEQDVDTAYGLIPIDPDQGLYVLRVTEDAGQRIGHGEEGEGPFSDPRIHPFGPLR